MLGEVPRGWEVTTLGDIATESRERFIPSGNSAPAVPYVGLEHIESSLPHVRHYGSSDDIFSQKTAFLAGDVLFGKLRAYLKKVAQVDRSGVCSTDILALRPRENADAKFLLNVLLRDETIHFAMGSSAGTKMPRTTWAALSELPVSLPPLPEQKKIAAILSSVDEAIQATQAVIDQTRRVKEGLLQDLLTRGIGHTRFKQTEIGEIPEGWQLRAIDDVATVLLSNVDKKSVAGQPAVRLCNYMDVYSNATITSRLDFMHATATPDQVVKFSLQQGDVLITKDSEDPADIGVPSVVSDEFSEPVLCGYHLAMLRPHSVHGPYLAWALRSHAVNEQFVRRANGSTRFGLTSGVIRSAVIPVPPLPEQKKIAATLSLAEAKIQSAQAVIDQTRQAKQGLLQDLLTGKVRVTP